MTKARLRHSKPIQAEKVEEMMRLLRNLARHKSKEAFPDSAGLNRHQKCIRVATDCIGLGSDIIAFAVLGLLPKVQSVWWSDNDPEKQQLYQSLCNELGHSPGKLEENMTKRSLSLNGGTSRDVPLHGRTCDADVYIAGYPCPSFSSLGRKKGTLDRRGDAASAHKKQLEKELKQTKAKQAEEKKQKTSQDESSGSALDRVAASVAQAKAPGPKQLSPVNKAAIVDQSNVEYYTAVQEDVRVILKALGTGFTQCEPLPIAEKDKEGVPLNRQRVLALAGHVFGDGVAAPPTFVAAKNTKSSDDGSILNLVLFNGFISKIRGTTALKGSRMERISWPKPAEHIS
eukprot:s1796_g19.t1